MAESRKKHPNPASAPKPLQAKVARTWSETHFNRPLNWPLLLLSASIKQRLCLYVPHTVVTQAGQESAFLYTDNEGVLRSRSGENARIAREFLESCGSNRRKERNFNPSGLRFPKFIRRNEGILVLKKHDLGDLAALGVLQRYIIPFNFKPHRRIILWRRIKPTKVYTLLLRSDSGQNQLISKRELEACDVHLEIRMSQAEESILHTVKRIVEIELGVEERLEELVVNVMQDLQGTPYFLSAPRARTSLCQKVNIKQLRRGSMPTIAELTTRLQAAEEQNPLPLLTNPLSLTPLAVPAVSTRRRYSEIAEHIDLVAAKFDRITGEAKERRAAFEVYRVLTSSNYPPGFFDSSVKAISVAICRNQVLAPFFGGKEARVEEIVRKILVLGVDLGRAQAVHAAMGVRKAEFEAFVGIVEDCLRRQGAQEQDVEKTVVYLQGFEEAVVGGKDVAPSP